MLKKYGKAIEQPQGPLPLTLTVSRRTGPQNPEEPAGSLCRTALRTSFLFQHPEPLLPAEPSAPSPSGECGRCKESDGNRRGADRLEAPRKLVAR